MVSQRELDERLRAVDAQLQVEKRDWQEEERKLYELEDAYLRDSTLHGNLFTGWGDPKTAPIRFRNAALRRKKRERQDVAQPATLSTEEQLKVDKHRLGSFSSVTSPAEPMVATLCEREKALVAKIAAKAGNAISSRGSSAATSEGNLSAAKKHKK